MKKYLLFTLVMLVCIGCYAQTEINGKLLFIRVFDLNGEKMSKGKVFIVTDSTLHIKTSSGVEILPISIIKKIKTKRSAGNNILIGSLIGFASGAVLGITTADPDAWFGYTAAEGATGIGIVGAVAGSTVGAITIAFKNSTTFIVDGKSENWNVIKNYLVSDGK